MSRLTVKDLLDQRGKHAFAMLRVETLDEAAAAAQVGVELLSVPPAMVFDRRFREVAPDVFIFPGDNFYEIGGTDDFLKWAFPLFKHGADAFYCSGSMATIRAMTDHGLPFCGHVGLIPSKRTWNSSAHVSLAPRFMAFSRRNRLSACMNSANSTRSSSVRVPSRFFSRS